MSHFIATCLLWCVCQLKLSTWEKPRNLDEVFNLIQDYHLPPHTPLFFVTYLCNGTIKKMNYFGHKKYIFARKVHLLVEVSIVLSVSHAAEPHKSGKGCYQCFPLVEWGGVNIFDVNQNKERITWSVWTNFNFELFLPLFRRTGNNAMSNFQVLYFTHFNRKHIIFRL